MDCNSEPTRPAAHCYKFFVDRRDSNARILTVECLVDCDCGVGQRCGIPILKEDQVIIQGTAAPFTSLREDLPTWLKKRVQNVATAVDGFPINSKCLEYSYNDKDALPGYCTTEESYGAHAESFWKIVEQVPNKDDGTVDTPLNVVRKPYGLSKAVAKPDGGKARWCGEVNVFHDIAEDTFAPPFYTVVDLRASNKPDYTSKKNMARHSTGDAYDTAAVCPKVVEADAEKCDQCRGDCGVVDLMPDDELSFFDTNKFYNIISPGNDLKQACSVSWTGTGTIFTSGSSWIGSVNYAACRTCMDSCPVSFKYAASESIEAMQKPCIAKCLLPYASCIIDVKVGLSARGPSGWADVNETVRPVGYVGNDFNTMLWCGRSIDSGSSSDPLHDFFKTLAW
ncbi:hypothetical protein T484DRAFT_1831757 [Baffinella frigidus]|nr:hypothetical protein T484DRAFT_1831757 [Cryptophyta sp. CCMP2293]